MTGDEKKIDQFRRIGMFPNEVKSRLLLVERYFQSMEKPNSEEFKFVEIVIDESQFNRIKNTIWEEGEKIFVYGPAIDALCIPVDDLFAIHNTIIDVLKEAAALIENQ